MAETSRPEGRAALALSGAPSRAPSRVAALVLAAGLSSRMAPHNKLLLRDGNGEAMVARVVDAALASLVCGVWVVVGHQAERIAVALNKRDVRLVHARDYASGLAFSLSSGIAALPADVTAALVCLGDMPEVSSAVMNQILCAYEPVEGRSIVVPVHRGRRGNPVLWDRCFFPDIMALSGDRGARRLFERHAAHLCQVDVASGGVVRDFDTPDALIERI